MCINDELLVALLFLRESVVDGPPRRVSTCHRERLCIFTDASHEQQGANDLLKEKKHLDVVLFVDNRAALSCLISGRAEGVASSSLRRLLELEENHDLNFWFEWVPSESNPADAPSRRDLTDLDLSLHLKLSCLTP